MTRPTRYTENKSNRDWIDEFCATSTPEEVRGAFRFTIGKYLRRYGKKDDHLQEALKIQDYANRLVEYESSLSKPIIRELYTDADEARSEIIGQNGNTAEHYEQVPDWSKAPEGATRWVPETDSEFAAWYKKKGDQWMFWVSPHGSEWVETDCHRAVIPHSK